MARSVAAIALASLVVLGGVRSAVADDAHADYMLHCQGCHGPNGEGAPGGIPSFRGSLGKFLSVSGGREYLMRVPGTAQSELSDRRVASVLNWMLQTFSAQTLPPDFAPFSEAEVARTRRPPLIDVTTVRQSLVSRIDARERAHVGSAWRAGD